MRGLSFCLVSVFLLFSFCFPNTVTDFAFGEETETQTESPATKQSAQLSLRHEPKDALSANTVRAMLKKHDFYDRRWNPKGLFRNDFVDNGDGTVTDRATGLMWQKEGSSRPLTLRRSTAYIRSLNDKRFMGYSDWRMPTVDELASLLSGNARRGLYIDPLFTTKQSRCWSADSGFVQDRELKEVWLVSFTDGVVVLQMLADHTPTIFDYPERYYVRGVRSAK